MGGETDPMGGETRNFGQTFGSQGITALYPYSRYNGITGRVQTRLTCTEIHLPIYPTESRENVD